MRRVLSFVLGPVFAAALLFVGGVLVSDAGMTEARLSYDALGGPAAYVLYGVVVGLGVLLFAFDAVVRAVRLRVAAGSVRRHARSLPPARGHLGRPLSREVVARSVRASSKPRTHAAPPTLAAWR